MIVSLLAVGFLLGLKHALEADHIAAVASLASRAASLRETVRVAGAWGIGHAATLVVFGGVLVALGATLPPTAALLLEGAVGLMLILLGADVLRRLRRRRYHFHVHTHARGAPHVHLHAHHHMHARHENTEHDHPHGRAFVPRALLIGCVHGLAGTAGLVLLAVPLMHSGVQAITYLVVFGAGTVLGMIGFSLLISVPLTLTARRLRRATVALEGLLGLANLGLGAWICFQSAHEIFTK